MFYTILYTDYDKIVINNSKHIEKIFLDNILGLASMQQ